ncbi:MAG: IS481 family transposase, partial [Beijerinckiaceae bacterium]
KSTVLSVEEEAVIVAFRKHTLLPLDDCLYSLQATIPHLTHSSRPKRFHRPTNQAVRDEIAALRSERMPGKQITKITGVSPATVSRVLRAARLSRMKDINPKPPVRRYEREHLGDMIHLDIKKLGRFDRVGHRITDDRRGQSNARGVGWEFVHVCIDDNSRIAFTDVMPDQKAVSAIAFLKAAMACYASLGVTVRCVMTDNGSCCKSFAFRDACRDLGLKHIRTKPYTPQTNGKAERFIKTALAEWAYARSYSSSKARTQQLKPWTHQYNWHRPHGSLNSMPPISRLGLSEDNLLRLHS